MITDENMQKSIQLQRYITVFYRCQLLSRIPRKGRWQSIETSSSHPVLHPQISATGPLILCQTRRNRDQWGTISYPELEGDNWVYHPQIMDTYTSYIYNYMGWSVNM